MLVNRVIPKIAGTEINQPQLIYSKKLLCCMKLTSVKILWMLILKDQKPFCLLIYCHKETLNIFMLLH